MFNEVNKKLADERLRDGMVEVCGRHENCVEAARHVYYPVVRKYNRPEGEHNKWDEKEGKVSFLFLLVFICFEMSCGWELMLGIGKYEVFRFPGVLWES